jgi:hypothetical protein
MSAIQEEDGRSGRSDLIILGQLFSILWHKSEFSLLGILIAHSSHFGLF